MRGLIISSFFSLTKLTIVTLAGDKNANVNTHKTFFVSIQSV